MVAKVILSYANITIFWSEKKNHMLIFHDLIILERGSISNHKKLAEKFLEYKGYLIELDCSIQISFQ
jgi:hypothetical protein